MNQARDEKKRGWYWPLIVLGLLGGLLVMNVIMFFVASDDPSFAVEKNYYQKALDWDKKRAQDTHNDDLGWALLTSVTDAGKAGATIEVRLSDRTGATIPDATVLVTAFHLARSADESQTTLSLVEPGVYRAVAPMWRPGLWELRFTVTRNAETFTKTVREDYQPGG